VDVKLLELKGVNKFFGKLQAVNGLDLEVEQGEVHSLIGPNGAGKTTVFNLVAGTFPVTSGKIFFKGENITRLQPHKIAQKGITRSFQGSALFMRESVLNNLMMGFHIASIRGPVQDFLHTRSARRIDAECRKKALEIIDFMGLSAQKNQIAGSLPHGHQRALGVSLALACAPTLLLLDEPVTGMNPTETQEMVDRIKKIQSTGISIILVEHTMKVVMNVSDRITVLSYGQKIAEGKPDEIRNNKQVIEAYLGKEDN
jgi:branched-chain amino acid transport system ATP-binding protein